LLRHGGVDDQHDRRRDENAEAAAGADDAGRIAHIVLRLEHRRQSEQAHQRYNGANNAGGGREDRAGRQRRDCQRTGKPSRGKLKRIKEPADDIRSFDHISHEQEQRHGDENFVRHNREGVLHEEIEYPVVEYVLELVWHRIGVIAKTEPHRDQCKCDREADQHDKNKQSQHQKGDLRIGHRTFSSACSRASSISSSC
jgi:hypothetical protein